MALLGELGGSLDAGEPGADDGDRCLRGQLVDRGAQPLRQFQFGYGISEFGRAGHCRRHGAGAADGVDDVVVVQRAARGQPHLAISGVDAGGAVDVQLHAVTEQRAVVGGGVAGPGRELMQPKALDELRAWVDEGDVDAGVLLQTVGRQGSGVSAADDDDFGVGVVISHALEIPAPTCL